MIRETFGMESLSSSAECGNSATKENSVESAEITGQTLKELTSRLIAHMEQVRHLRAQNAKLSEEATGLKQRWGRETEKVRQLYDRELTQLRTILDNSENSRSQSDAKLKAAEAQNATLLSEQKKSDAQVDRLEEHLEKTTEELGEKSKALLVLQRRVNFIEREKAAERERRIQLKKEADFLRTKVESDSARLDFLEKEKRRLKAELDFQRQVHTQEQRELQVLLRQPAANERLLEQYRAEHSQALAEMQKEFEHRLEALHSSLRLTYEKKIQEILQANDNNAEVEVLRQQNKQLTHSLAGVTERFGDLKAANEKLSHDLTEKSAVLASERRKFSEAEERMKRELSAVSTQARRLTEEVNRSADTKGHLDREINAFRVLMAQELSAEEPKPGMNYSLSRQGKQSPTVQHRQSSPKQQHQQQQHQLKQQQEQQQQLVSQQFQAPSSSSNHDQQISGSSENLKLNANAGYRRSRGEPEMTSLSKTALPRFGVSMQGSVQPQKQS